jgi:hypothetical protein
MAKPTAYDLWVQSGENPERYRELMHEAGFLLLPGDEGYEGASRNLPCGWRCKHRKALLEHLDEFCLYCLAGDCGSCEGAPCQCGHGSEPAPEPALPVAADPGQPQMPGQLPLPGTEPGP